MILLKHACKVNGFPFVGIWISHWRDMNLKLVRGGPLFSFSCISFVALNQLITHIHSTLQISLMLLISPRITNVRGYILTVISFLKESLISWFRILNYHAILHALTGVAEWRENMLLENSNLLLLVSRDVLLECIDYDLHILWF